MLYERLREQQEKIEKTGDEAPHHQGVER